MTPVRIKVCSVAAILLACSAVGAQPPSQTDTDALSRRATERLVLEPEGQPRDQRQHRCLAGSLAGPVLRGLGGRS